MRVWIQTLISDINDVVTNRLIPNEREIWDRAVTTKWLQENEMDYEWAGQLFSDLLALKDFEKDEKVNLDN